MAQANPLVDWQWKIGVPKDFWSAQLKNVEKYVTANKEQLKKVEVSTRAGLSPSVICSVGPEVATKASGESKAIAAIQLPEWINGGMRTPHLHYNGEIYILTKEQWKQFSGQILKEFSKKLADTSTISFEQLMELSDTVNSVI